MLHLEIWAWAEGELGNIAQRAQQFNLPVERIKSEGKGGEKEREKKEKKGVERKKERLEKKIKEQER